MDKGNFCKMCQKNNNKHCHWQTLVSKNLQAKQNSRGERLWKK